MKKFFVVLCLAAMPALAQDNRAIPFDTGTVITQSSYTARSGPHSGKMLSIDVGTTTTGLVSLALFTSSTNGSLVSKSLLAVPSVNLAVAGASYYPRTDMHSAAGAVLSNSTPVEIMLRDDIVVCVVSNLAAAGTNNYTKRVKLKINLE